MKRLISVILFISLILCLYGCNNKSETDIHIPVSFYYCADPIVYNEENGVIAPEIRDAEGLTSDLELFLKTYLKGPISENFRSPFPSNTTITQLTQDDDSIHIVFGKEFGELTGLELTLARACLAKTIIEYTQVDAIQISFESDTIGSRQTVTLRPDSFLFTNETVISTDTGDY